MNRGDITPRARRRSGPDMGPGTIHTLSDTFSEGRLLDELAEQVVSRADRIVFRRVFLVRAGRQTFDHCIVVGLMEEYDRYSVLVLFGVERWIDHAMHRRNPSVVGPLLHQVADIDNERPFDDRDVDPLGSFVLYLQAAVREFLAQNGQAAVVGMR